MTKLSELAAGNKATIVGFNTDHGHQERLKSLGLVPGTEIEIQRHAPLGDPVQIFLRGFSLGIRKADAKNLMVQVIDS